MEGFFAVERIIVAAGDIESAAFESEAHQKYKNGQPAARPRR